MSGEIKIHTTRTLYDKWNKKHQELGIRIEKLKERRDKAKNDDELKSAHYELQEVLIESQLIHQFLADVGVMVYAEEQRESILKSK